MKGQEVLFSSKNECWETPKVLFEKLDEIFNFTLDPCASKTNAKCKKFYTIEDDGLTKSWHNEVVFCNPPYGKSISKWVEKCYFENKNNNAFIVMLIPSRTDTKWFHDYIYLKHTIIFYEAD